MPLHPTPQQSAPTKVAPVDWSKLRVKPTLLTTKRPGTHVGRTAKTQGK